MEYCKIETNEKIFLLNWMIPLVQTGQLLGPTWSPTIQNPKLGNYYLVTNHPTSKTGQLSKKNPHHRYSKWTTPKPLSLKRACTAASVTSYQLLPWTFFYCKELLRFVWNFITRGNLKQNYIKHAWVRLLILRLPFIEHIVFIHLKFVSIGTLQSYLMSFCLKFSPYCEFSRANFKLRTVKKFNCSLPVAITVGDKLLKPCRECVWVAEVGPDGVGRPVFQNPSKSI